MHAGSPCREEPVFAGKPIIGLTGGIGSGKSFVADLFGEAGCLVIRSDELVRQAYESDAVKQMLRRWWGSEVFTNAGRVDRERQRRMAAATDNSQVLAFVWDTPLLLESKLEGRCDAVVFVEAPAEVRLARVERSRGWDGGELNRRENFQMPLDKKAGLADYVIRNTADAEFSRSQVREVLSRILSGTT